MRFAVSSRQSPTDGRRCALATLDQTRDDAQRAAPRSVGQLSTPMSTDAHADGIDRHVEVEAPSDAFLPKFITDRPTWTDDLPSRLGAGDPALIQATDPRGESRVNGEQLAQAAPQPPGAPPQKQKTTLPKQPAKRPQPAPVQHVSPKEAQQRAARWDEIIRGQPDTPTQPLLPDDWQKTQNEQYVAWIRDASKQTGVPLELLARHYDADADRRDRQADQDAALAPSLVDADGLHRGAALSVDRWLGSPTAQYSWRCPAGCNGGTDRRAR